MSDIFDVIADGTRRGILSRLRGGAATVSDLTEALGVTQPTVSKHLAKLREAELVSVREDGRTRVYTLRPGPLGTVREWLDPLTEQPPSESASADDGGPTVFGAWAGTETADRVGRAAADATHSARSALESAQEMLHEAQQKLQAAQQKVAEKMPKWGRDE